MVAEALSSRILRMRRTRDNITYALIHEELSHEDTLQLETQLSCVEDELVRLLTENAA